VKSNNEFDSELELDNLDSESKKPKRPTDNEREGIIREEEELYNE
jgi:hypothetical protein